MNSPAPPGDLRAVHGASSGLVQPQANYLLRPGDLELGHRIPRAVEQLHRAAPLPNPAGHRGVFLHARVVLVDR